MSKINAVQNAILQLEGGAFQKLFDAYLYKRYNFTNIQTLGVQTATNKPTKGTPDSYVLKDDDKYILINYGTVGSRSIDKIKSDILSCFENGKLNLDKEKINKIICGYSSSNIHIEDFDEIRELIKDVNIELIGIDTLSHDLTFRYPHIAKEYLGIEIDTNQIFDISDFIKASDASGTSAPVNTKFQYREKELEDLYNCIDKNKITIVLGPSGIGKTRLAIEVCRTFENENWKVFCVRSNGRLLYDDLSYYISDDDNYLLFFDDANMVASLGSVIDTLITNDRANIKIMLTVRDYACDKVFSAIDKFSIPAVYQVKPFSDEEIVGILSRNLDIRNNTYQKRIVDISNGNIRIAVLAGMRAKELGYKAILNANDVFSNYYKRILETEVFNKSDIILLFFISLTGPVKCDNNTFYSALLARYLPDINEEELYNKLYSLEIIDWFEKEVVRISDQSLGNFLLYYVLFEKKWLDLSEIISLGFPTYKTKVVYAIQTLMQLFRTEELEGYISRCVNAAWDASPSDNDYEYMKSFSYFNQLKSLSILRLQIVNTEAEEFSDNLISIKKNNHGIKNKEIEILSGYKYSDYYLDAVDLMLSYLILKPSLMEDVYFAIVDELLFDSSSYNYKYRLEKELIDAIVNKSDNWENPIISTLFLNIADVVLGTEFSFTEPVKNGRSFNFIRMTLAPCDEIFEIRRCVWNALSELYNIPTYRNHVLTILKKQHVNGLYDDATYLFLKSDFNSIYSIVGNETLDFNSALIINTYKKNLQQLNVIPDSRYFRSVENEEYRIYSLLSCDHYLSLLKKDDEKADLIRIQTAISKFKLDDFQHLFSICKRIEKDIPSSESWEIKTGLEYVFRLLEKEKNIFVDVVKEYLDLRAPFSINCNSVISFMLNEYGYEKTIDLISVSDFPGREVWKSTLWSLIDANRISRQVTVDFMGFIKDELVTPQLIPNIKTVIKFCNIDSGVLDLLCQKLAINSYAEWFIIQIRDEADVINMMKLFQDRLNDLYSIYRSSLSDKADPSGVLFWELYSRNSVVWKDFIDWLKDNLHEHGIGKQIVDQMWKTSEYSERISYAFATLINGITFYNEVAARILFNSSDDITSEKKQDWLMDALTEHYEDIAFVKRLVNSVSIVYPEFEAEYLVQYLKLNKNVECFKELYLFPLSESWSGSRIPLINKKINILEAIKDRLVGIDYIEHKLYLQERIESYNELKAKEMINEYLENNR